MAFWAFVEVWLLAAGVLSLVMSLVWRAPNLMLNFTISSADLTGACLLALYHASLFSCRFAMIAGTVLGIFLLVTFALSVFAIVQKNHVTVGLVILNWVLIMDAIAVIVIGSFIWFYSLQQRNNYFKVFQAAGDSVRSQIQDKVRLQCGATT